MAYAFLLDVPPLTNPRERLLVALSRYRVQLGFCFAVPALLFARPTSESYLLFLPIVLAGLAVRTWARGHLDRAERVCTGGPYGWVRHPLYIGWLMTFWLTPSMSAGHLLFSLVMTSYILIAIPLEESDLLRALGEPYRRWRERTPLFVPRFGAAAPPARSAEARTAESQ